MSAVQWHMDNYCVHTAEAHGYALEVRRDAEGIGCNITVRSAPGSHVVGRGWVETGADNARLVAVTMAQALESMGVR